MKLLIPNNGLFNLERTLYVGMWIVCVSDETQRRITLLPERLHEDNKVALKNIFGSLSNVLEELSNKEANDILVRASPKEVSYFGYCWQITVLRSQKTNL
jgi:hypothetical protein